MNKQRRTPRQIQNIIRRNNMMKENKFLVYLGIILRNIVNVIKGILGFIFRLIGIMEMKMVIIFLFLYILYNFSHYFFQIEYSINLPEYKEFISTLLILLLIIFCIYNFETGKKKVKRGKKVEEEKTKGEDKQKEDKEEEDKGNFKFFAKDDEDGPLIVSDEESDEEPDADL